MILSFVTEKYKALHQEFEEESQLKFTEVKGLLVSNSHVAVSQYFH